MDDYSIGYINTIHEYIIITCYLGWCIIALDTKKKNEKDGCDEGYNFIIYVLFKFLRYF